ncbi:MAG: minor capsid protein [Chthoniobacterales bacterium]
MDVVERYNLILRATEDDILRLLNRVLDQAFNRLMRRARIHMRIGRVDPVQRNLALLQEFRQLVPSFRPDRVDAYDRLLQRLVSQAGARGIEVADNLTQRMTPDRPRVDVSIPLEATVAAAAQAKGYLTRHGADFAQKSAEIVAQGIAEGRPTSALIQDMRSRLGVVKSRAETIVRTESLRAYNEASNTYYAAQGIDLVSFYATSDDRSCPICTARAGRIYKRSEIKVPLHPRCRCFLSPWDADLAAIDPDYAAGPARHRAEVARQSQNPLSDDLTRSVFEQLAPMPVASNQPSS